MNGRMNSQMNPEDRGRRCQKSAAVGRVPKIHTMAKSPTVLASSVGYQRNRPGEQRGGRTAQHLKPQRHLHRPIGHLAGESRLAGNGIVVDPNADNEHHQQEIDDQTRHAQRRRKSAGRRVARLWQRYEGARQQQRGRTACETGKCQQREVSPGSPPGLGPEAHGSDEQQLGERLHGEINAGPAVRRGRARNHAGGHPDQECRR